MWRRASLRALRCGIAGLLLVLGLPAATALAQDAVGPKVDILQVSGPLDRTVMGYLDRALARAATDDVEIVVMQLDSPGALGLDLQALTRLVLQSDVPVAVWVGPAGARATGAAVQVALAADVLALAPGALLGGASPPDLAVRPTSQSRASTAAELQRLAGLRVRDQAQASAFADGAAIVASDREPATLTPDARIPRVVDRERVTVSSAAALAEHRLADLIAADLTELLQALDGREITRADGTTVILDVDPVTASVRFNNQGLWGRVLHAAVSPTLAYLLVVGGLVALLFEWFQPGFGVAGVSGLLTGALGAYGLAVLPTRWWALALLVAGLVLFAVDLALARLGAATAMGAVAVAAGSWWLYAGAPELGLAWWLIVVVVVACVVFFVFIMTTVLRAQGAVARASANRVVGQLGVVRSVLNPEGHVFVAGMLWRARVSGESATLPTGTTVRVVGLNEGETLDVRPAEASGAQTTDAMGTR